MSLVPEFEICWPATLLVKEFQKGSEICPTQAIAGFNQPFCIRRTNGMVFTHPSVCPSPLPRGCTSKSSTLYLTYTSDSGCLAKGQNKVWSLEDSRLTEVRPVGSHLPKPNLGPTHRQSGKGKYSDFSLRFAVIPVDEAVNPGSCCILLLTAKKR